MALTVRDAGGSNALFLKTLFNATAADSGKVVKVDGTGAIVLGTGGGGGAYEVQTGISAAGTTQGAATLLTKNASVVSTVAANSGVRLADSATLNDNRLVINKGANALKIYPHSGGVIDALATNAAYSLPAGQYVQFFAISSTNWVTAVGSGTAGPAGTNGSVWYYGSGAPSSGTGVDNDFYLNLTNSDVYQKSGGAWSVVANIKGATGGTGPQGIQGVAGPTGGYTVAGTNTLTVATVAPSSPALNDLWIQV